MASLFLKKGVFIVLCVFMQKERKAPFRLLYLKQHKQERKNMQHSSKSVNTQHRLQVSEYQEWDKWPSEADKATDYFLKVSGLFYIAT